mmetsp:Transcript_31736/g.95403  ORF Transcript_31736/g.95403 Transcript_31736/m.95403 type:complete len:259 (-) Transcript_31736:290-1066(-)
MHCAQSVARAFEWVTRRKRCIESSSTLPRDATNRSTRCWQSTVLPLPGGDFTSTRGRATPSISSLTMRLCASVSRRTRVLPLRTASAASRAGSSSRSSATYLCAVIFCTSPCTWVAVSASTNLASLHWWINLAMAVGTESNSSSGTAPPTMCPARVLRFLVMTPSCRMISPPPGTASSAPRKPRKLGAALSKSHSAVTSSEPMPPARSFPFRSAMLQIGRDVRASMGGRTVARSSVQPGRGRLFFLIEVLMWPGGISG